MIDVVGYAESRGDEIRDARTGPQIRRISGGSSPLEQRSLENALVLRAQAAGSSRRRLRRDPPFSLRAIGGLPAPNASAIDAEHPGHVNRLISLGKKDERSFAPPLQSLRASEWSHVPPPARSVGHSLCRSQ